MRILSIIALVFILIPPLAYADVISNDGDNLAEPMTLIMAEGKSKPIDFDEMPFPDTL